METTSLLSQSYRGLLIHRIAHSRSKSFARFKPLPSEKKQRNFYEVNDLPLSNHYQFCLFSNLISFSCYFFFFFLLVISFSFFSFRHLSILFSFFIFFFLDFMLKGPLKMHLPNLPDVSKHLLPYCILTPVTLVASVESNLESKNEIGGV